MAFGDLFGDTTPACPVKDSRGPRAGGRMSEEGLHPQGKGRWGPGLAGVAGKKESLIGGDRAA